MAYSKSRGNNSAVVVATLGGLVGLTLGLYIFSEVLDVIFPLLYTCANTTHTYSTITACCYTGTNCLGALNTSATVAGYFGTTLTFIDSILPVVGIIAGYIMIKGAINRMG